MEPESLITDGTLNELACTNLLNDFLKLLQWYHAHRAKCEESKARCEGIPAGNVSQIIRYTDRLMEMFNNPSSYIQLWAARLLLSKAMPVFKLVMKLGPDAFDDDRIHTESERIFTTCIVLLECFMLNCLSQKPVEEINPEVEQLLFFLLYKQLEYIQTENSQHMIKLIVINSILNAIYWRLKWTSSLYCPLSEKCIVTIKTVASTYPIQMLKILAKSVLCSLWSHLDPKPHQTVQLDEVEVQSCLNFLQSRAPLYQAATLPICSFMNDLIIVSQENRYSFFKWNASELLLSMKGKCEDVAVADSFDRLMLVLMSGGETPALVKGKMLADIDGETENQDLYDINSSFETTFGWFDLFSIVTKHFIAHVENSLLISTNLTLSMVNSITPIFGLIEHMIIVNKKEKLLNFLAKESQFLSVINHLLDKWPELPDCFPLFGNAFYGCLISGSNHKDFCFELGRSGLLHRLLSMLYALGVVGDILKFGDIGNVIGILVIIFNCALQKIVIPALEIVSTVNILPAFIQCPVIRVAVLAKFALSFMEFALEDPSVLVLTAHEIIYINSQLSKALVDGSSEDWYTDLELLRVLTNLTQSPHFSTNVIQMITGKSLILPTVIKFLQSDKLDVQRASLRLLLNFYSQAAQPSMPEVNTEIALGTLAATEDVNIRQLAICAQLLLDSNLDKKPDQILLCIELCCKFNLYDKCVQLCSMKTVSLSSKHYLFKGKSLFHLYRREQGFLTRYSDTLSDQEIISRRSSCYKKAEECIKILGVALDNECIDSEGSRMLDIAMSDYIRETNKLNNLKRCLLCRKKRSLMKSHLWPRSFLRRYSYSRVHDISSRIFISFHSLKPREKSPGEVTYWMLCGECEQRICQNGEDKFTSEAYDLVSSASENAIKISYGPWLYNFSIGLVFRTFLYFNYESAESYLIFQQCRERLLNLPVKYKTNSTTISLIASAQEDKESVPSISPPLEDIVVPVVILVNPTKTSIDFPRKSILIGALFDAGSAFMSRHYLSTGKLDLSGQEHFIVVRLGNLSILLPLKASTDYNPPPGSLIRPQGGELFVPGENSRWDLIPEGLWEAIDSTAILIEETSLHHYTYKSKTGNWKSHSAEEYEPFLSRELMEKERLLNKNLKEVSSSPESALISRFLNEASPSLSFLPEEIKLLQKHKYTQKRFLQLPSSHVVLFHKNIDLAEDGFTVFLVAKIEDNPCTVRTYIIFVELVCGVQIAYGAYVTIDTNNSFSITDSLIDMKKFSEHYRERYKYYCQIVRDLLPLMLNEKGCEIAQRAKITKLSFILLSLGSLDSKCENGCWYCEGLCHHCLQPASVGYSLRTTARQILKFCKSNFCYSLYSQDSIAAPVIIMPLPIPGSELLLQITKVISTGWSENTLMIIQLCVATIRNVHGFSIGQLYVLIQFRTLYFQTFFDFSITNKFVPLKALHYMQHKNLMIMHHSALLMLTLRLVIEDALHKTSFKTLERLLDSHQSTMQDHRDQLETKYLHEEMPDQYDVSTEKDVP